MLFSFFLKKKKKAQKACSYVRSFPSGIRFRFVFCTCLDTPLFLSLTAAVWVVTCQVCYSLHGLQAGAVSFFSLMSPYVSGTLESGAGLELTFGEPPGSVLLFRY